MNFEHNKRGNVNWHLRLFHCISQGSKVCITETAGSTWIDSSVAQWELGVSYVRVRLDQYAVALGVFTVPMLPPVTEQRGQQRCSWELKLIHSVRTATYVSIIIFLRPVGIINIDSTA